MKLCLAVLAITFLGFANGNTIHVGESYDVNCGPGEIKKTDGCVPAAPTGDPACPSECPPSQDCFLAQPEIFIRDLISTYVTEKDCGYRYERECKPQRAIMECVEENVTISNVCAVSCETKIVDDCKIATREIEEVENDRVCEPKTTQECTPEWVVGPCPHNNEETCRNYECTGNYVTKIIQDCRDVAKKVKRYVDYELCKPREVMECTQDPPKTITYQKLGNCKRRVYEDCIEKLVEKKCIEKHVLLPHVIAINATVAMCDAGFMSDPYYYDFCKSATCHPTTLAVYEDFKMNPVVLEA